MALPSRAYRLYAVTADKYVRSPEYFLPRLRAACEAGITVFQLRLKDTPLPLFLEIAKGCKEVCANYNVPFFIDDSLEVVRAVAADGIHVGKDDTPLAELMRQRPPVRVGYSVYNDAQRLRDAIACPLVDYVGVTVYATPTKPESTNDRGPVALAELRSIRDNLNSTLPLVAIGGLEAQHAAECFQAGADGIAVVRAIWEGETTEDVKRRVADLRREVDQHCPPAPP
eukprot:EG_transcript_22875